MYGTIFHALETNSPRLLFVKLLVTEARQAMIFAITTSKAGQAWQRFAWKASLL